MRFLLDVSLSPKLLWEFQRLGHECEHVAASIGKNARDRQIAEYANHHGAILVSKDADFAEFSRAGLLRLRLIWLRCGNMSAQDTCALVRGRLPDALAAFSSGLQIAEIHDRPPTPKNP